jgi:hypothetical protein
MKAEFIHVILGQDYFATEEMVIKFDSVKRMSFVTTCMCKLYVAFGVTLVKKEDFRGKRGNF